MNNKPYKFNYREMSTVEGLFSALADPSIEHITIEASGVVLHKIPVGYEGHGWYYVWGYDPGDQHKEEPHD